MFVDAHKTENIVVNKVQNICAHNSKFNYQS